MRHRSQGQQVSLGLFLIAGSMLLTGGLTIAAAPATRIACGQCEEADRFVRLQAVGADDRPAGTQRLTHPFTLSPEDWTSILTELHVQRQAEGLLLSLPQGPMLSAFTDEETTYLSVTLSKAFAHAQPNEWVVFGLSRTTPQGLTELTTGGWYLEGASLHLVLANYRKVVTMASTRQLLWERPLRPDAGPSYNLVAGPHQVIVEDSGSMSRLLSSAPSELAIAYQALLLGEQTTAAGSRDPSTMTPSPAHAPKTAPPPSSIEERLQALKRLHAQGLITEEEYRAKKQQLLERF